MGSFYSTCFCIHKHCHSHDERSNGSKDFFFLSFSFFCSFSVFFCSLFLVLLCFFLVFFPLSLLSSFSVLLSFISFLCSFFWSKEEREEEKREGSKTGRANKEQKKTAQQEKKRKEHNKQWRWIYILNSFFSNFAILTVFVKHLDGFGESFTDWPHRFDFCCAVNAKEQFTIRFPELIKRIACLSPKVELEPFCQILTSYGMWILTEVSKSRKI